MPIIHIRAPEGTDEWTDYLAEKGSTAGINRGCSLGWHLDCSDPFGEDCRCHCHPWPVDDVRFTDEGSE